MFSLSKKSLSLTAGAVAVLAAGIAIWLILGPSASDQFALRQKVSANSDLHFSFPELMDKKSVEAQLQKPENLDGTWQWDSDVLVFHPSAPLKAGATYAFHLPGEAQTAGGEPFNRTLDFIFTVAGPPKLVAQVPGRNAMDIRSDSKITLVFDRAMVPLTQVQGDPAKEKIEQWPVTIKPEVAGRWRWLSTVAIEFIPSKPLTKSTKYTVTVPVGIGTVIGDKTEEDFSWSFETMRPQVTSTFPFADYQLAGPTTEFLVQFSDEVDRKSAGEHIHLIKTAAPATGSAMPPGERVAVAGIAYGTRVEEDGKTVTDKSIITFKAAKALQFQSSYALYVAPGVRGTEGDLGSASGSLANFKTVGPVTVVTGTYENGGIHIKLTNPVDSGSVLKAVTIDPPVIKEKTEDGKEKEIWTVPGWDGTTVDGYPALKPRTKYTVTVGTGLKDTFGQSLGKPFTFSFTTPPVSPKVFIHSKGEFGIFEKDKPPVYYVNNVNVSKIDVKFAPLSLPDFLRLRSQAPYYYGDGQYDGPHPTLDGLPGLQTTTIKPGGKPDLWEAIPFDASKTFSQSMGAGLYVMEISAPEYVDSQKKQPILDRQYFALTNMSITLKYSGDRTLVWVTDMQTGNPVQGAAITFTDTAGTPRLTGATDKEGFFSSALNLASFPDARNSSYPSFWVTAEKNGDKALVGSTWNEGIQQNNFSYYTNFRYVGAAPLMIDSYMYTERPLYSAGDTVNFKGIVRLRDWEGQYSVPGKDRQVIVNVTDGEGNQVYRTTLPFSAFGSFNGSFPIDPKAALGYYSINAQVTPDGDIGNNYIGTSFQTLAYRKPEYLVTVGSPRDNYVDGEKIEADIAGDYYFGAPMAGAKVQWRTDITEYFFNNYSYEDGWYSFNDYEPCYADFCSRATTGISTGEGTLNDGGRLHIAIPYNIAERPVSQVLSIEADVLDLNNQVVSARTSVIIHKSDTYVGIRNDDYVVTPGSKAAFAVITLKPDGSAQPGRQVTLKLFSRVWNTIRKKGVDGEYYYDNEPKDTFEREVTVTTDAAGKAAASLLVNKGGEYHVTATVRDSQGRETVAGTGLYAWSDTYVNWPRANTDRLEIVTDKTSYKPGDTAKLLVKSPFQGKGVKALVTVERGQIIKKWVVDVESNALPVEIGIDAGMIPNAYVSVMIIKPRQGETFDENGLDTGAPAFRLGYVRLGVDTASKRVDLSVTTDKEKYAPGETVQITLKTLDAAGKPVAAEVSVGTVDMSLLALTGFSLPDLVTYFYNDRGLGVNTAQLLTYLVERYKPGSKGGGGGDPETRKRGDFKDTAYWNPSVVTDANGTATVSFKLPDNLTTWQILAIASTKQSTFGAVAETFIETKQVIVRPVRPRFAVIGDEVTLGAVVHNFLDDAQTFTVSLKGAGFTAKSPVQQVTLKPGEQKKVLFPVTINPVEKLTLNFTAETGKYRDEIEESIPVYSFGVPQSAATTGIVAKGGTMEKVHAPSVADASKGELTLTVAPSMAAYLPKGLEYLAKYPYGCAEQVMSSFLPNVALSQLQGFEAFRIVDPAQLKDIVTKGFEKLYTFQRSDGGFGYWQDSRSSFPSLSAYILHGMYLAQQAKHPVDSGVMQRAQEYLNGILRSTKPEDQLDLATRTYIVFVLSETGRPQQSLLSNIYDQRSRLPLFAQAQLAMAYEKAGSDRAVTILGEMLNHARVDGRGTHFEEADEYAYGLMMNTNDRTTAMVLQAMIRIDPDHALIPNVTRALLSRREDGHWDTTQSTTQSLLALVEYLKSTDELNADFTAGALVNGKEKLKWKVGKNEVLQRKTVLMPLGELLRGKENQVQLQLQGEGRLYYDLILSYFYTPADAILPAEEGMSIRRDLVPMPGQKKEPTVGSIYQATLTITVPEERHFVAVESPLPAGMELIDTSFQTAQQNLLQTQGPDYWSADYWKSGEWVFTHKELRDDQMFLFAEYLPPGVYQYQYLVRATTPGRFHERPARVWQMYFPEVFGQSSGGWVTVKE